MAVKDKNVTLEALGILHEHNKEAYMSTTNPVGNGVMKMDGVANFTGLVQAGSLVLGNIELRPNEDYLEIAFLNG